MSSLSYITNARSLGVYSELEGDVLKELRRPFPAIQSRRMTPSALMIGHLLQDMTLEPADECIYLSTYSGSAHLDKYLESFPTPSPFYFQSSIHAAPLESLLVMNQLPVRSVVAYCGAEKIVAQGLLAAVLSDARRVHVLGAEEAYPKLSAHGLASDQGFAYALSLEMGNDAGANGAIGELCLDTEAEAPIAPIGYSPVLNSLQFHACIADRRNAVFPLEGVGRLSIHWYA